MRMRKINKPVHDTEIIHLHSPSISQTLFLILSLPIAPYISPHLVLVYRDITDLASLGLLSLECDVKVTITIMFLVRQLLILLDKNNISIHLPMTKLAEYSAFSSACARR